MKHRFICFTQFVFYGGQKAGNEFSGHFDNLKHRFIEEKQVAFCESQKLFIDF
jgi:hypothetical protein